MIRWRDIKDIDLLNDLRDYRRDIANYTGLAEVDENGLTWNQATIDKKWELMCSKTNSIYRPPFRVTRGFRWFQEPEKKKEDIIEGIIKRLDGIKFNHE